MTGVARTLKLRLHQTPETGMAPLERGHLLVEQFGRGSDCDAELAKSVSHSAPQFVNGGVRLGQRDTAL